MSEEGGPSMPRRGRHRKLSCALGDAFTAVNEGGASPKAHWHNDRRHRADRGNHIQRRDRATHSWEREEKFNEQVQSKCQEHNSASACRRLGHRAKPGHDNDGSHGGGEANVAA
eukprot:CAMPEP_0119489140 /NCGR_PEP_ID=MMETSP1344-20130328/14680_1 /TAXON_ID=236787 /ORGANISM="Florenciella parvula, Strain CCMP2471" /LENGTH=113 /DNA_ID=CAMNT_0007524149 /DNA_START=1208 /DNA_END=1550 /DNA_ORIENTATION=+